MDTLKRSPAGVGGIRTSFFSFTTTRAVGITMVVIAVVVFGLVSYQKLSLSLMPEISYPSVTIRTEYPGTAPEEIEVVVSRPVEQALGIVSGLVNITSISKAGVSDVVLEFEWDTDLDDAIAEIREKIDRLYFPAEVQRPMLLRYDPSLDPIIRLAVSGDEDLYALRLLAENEVERELEKVPGVAAVRVKGGLEEEIVVELDESRLSAMNIGLAKVSSRLAEENVNMAGGNLREGDTEYLVRTLNEFSTLEEISNLVVEEKGDAVVRISNLGRVYRGHKEREVITRVGGQESVEIEIFKEADANVVTVAQDVQRIIYGTKQQQAFVAKKPEKKENGDKAEEKKDYAQEKTMTNFIAHNLGEGIKINTLFDQSVFIKNSIDEVRNTALIGGLLAVIVLFIFLRTVSSTLIISLAIPISIIATFAPMYLFGVSLNIMSLGGLALGIGMLVDSSIVVLESIFRCRSEGDDLELAAVRGTGEVGGAVLASTLTTVAVFFPIVFVEGIAGQIFGDMALTVVFSLVTSLLVALFVIPMLASRDFGGGAKVGSRYGAIIRPSIKDNLSRLKQRVSQADGGGAKLVSGIAGWIVALAQELWALLYKTLAGLLVLLAALLKGILLLLAAIPLVPSAMVYKRFAVYLQKVAGQSAPFGSNLFDRYCPGIMAFSSVDMAKGSAELLAARMQTGSGLRRTCKWIFLLVPSIIYFVPRLLVGLLLELVSKLLLSIGLIVTVLLSSTVSLLALAVLPIIAPLVLLFNIIYQRIEQGYHRLLTWALENRTVVAAGSALLLLACIQGLLPRLGSELIPEVHQGEFDIQARLPVGTPLVRTDQYVTNLEKIVLADPDVENISTIVGVEKATNPTSEEGEHTGRIRVKVASAGPLAVVEERTIGRLRKALDDMPDLKAKIMRPVLFSFKTPVEVEIHGYELDKLRSLSASTVQALTGIDGLFDIRSNIQPGNPEVRISYDRDLLARHQLNIEEVAELIRGKVHGVVPTRYSRQERKIDVRVRVSQQDRKDVPSLARMVVNPGRDVRLPLSAVARLDVRDGPNEIRRIDQQRSALITANVAGRDLGSISREIGARMQALEMPADFNWIITGQSKEMERSSKSMIFALLLAVFLVYVVMASQFESLVHPLVIIFTIPLALIGVVLALYATETSISVVVFIGAIMLAGIVVNNAIVLVDYINNLRRNAGLARREAIVRAGSVRLRPILMTTATTVLGLLPMALGLGEGAEIRTPMALTVIAGLISATLLTLVVIPVVYDLLDRGE